MNTLTERETRCKFLLAFDPPSATIGNCCTGVFLLTSAFMTKKDEGEDKEVAKVQEILMSQLDGLAIKDTKQIPQNVLVCDAGYGFPREKRPFQEKMNAVASQLANFVTWQMGSGGDDRDLAVVQVVGCPDEITRDSLQARLLEKMTISSLPEHVTITCDKLEEYLVNEQGNQPSTSKDDNDNNKETEVYLSPDADESMDPARRPPRIVVVGLLIDRRVQPNRSKDRASKLDIVAKRWPLEECLANISAKEPLNVDCVLEGMQQWWWNCDASKETNKECFVKAAAQAIEHHAKRHPSRPLHISK